MCVSGFNVYFKLFYFGSPKISTVRLTHNMSGRGPRARPEGRTGTTLNYGLGDLKLIEPGFSGLGQASLSSPNAHIVCVFANVRLFGVCFCHRRMVW